MTADNDTMHLEGVHSRQGDIGKEISTVSFVENGETHRVSFIGFGGYWTRDPVGHRIMMYTDKKQNQVLRAWPPTKWGE